METLINKKIEELLELKKKYAKKASEASIMGIKYQEEQYDNLVNMIEKEIKDMLKFIK